ncbi:hypothetical protein F5Y18DRAFT_187247 [Xylariaceae sp. FL1019]|nr:hypothetical protein F5Y18DRAFT_187247 [Xylariaceae sp. FL1019]
MSIPKPANHGDVHDGDSGASTTYLPNLAGHRMGPTRAHTNSDLSATCYSETFRSRAGVLGALPYELVAILLSNFPDLPTLKNAILSCEYLFDIFQKDRERIISHILRNDLGDEVLREALFLDEQPHAPNFPDEITDMRPYPRERLDIPCKISLPRGLRLTNTHAKIRYLAENFVNGCATFDSRLGLVDSLIFKPVTASEWSRIERAIYLFFIFYDLAYIVLNNTNDFQLLKDMLISRLATWEHLEIGCVADVLGTNMARVVNEVARHELRFAHHNVPLNNSCLSMDVQGILVGGVDKVVRLLQAQTFEEKTLATMHDDEHCSDDDFTIASHEMANSVLWQVSRSAGSPSPASSFSSVSSTNSDRQQIWQDIHGVIYHQSSWSLYDFALQRWRLGGYMLWDTERLRSMPLFDGCAHIGVEPGYEDFVDWWDENKVNASMGKTTAALRSGRTWLVY